MKNKMDRRQTAAMIICMALMLLLFGRLFALTVLENGRWSEAAENLQTKTVYSAAPRGEIFDRCGRVLAENREIFSVNLVAANTDDDINGMALRLISLFEKNGDSYIDSFPIVFGEDGSMYYTYDREIVEWLLEHDMEDDLPAPDAFALLRERYDISEEFDAYKAQEILQNNYGLYPPISVKKMEYTGALERNTFLESFHLDTWLDAETAFRQLREKYEIDPALSDEDARRILIIRNILKNMGYQSYLPAEVAADVSMETVIELKEFADEYAGAEVVKDYVRSYPYGESASHIVGYLGRISESEQSEYLGKGYSSTDLIGKEGIESYYESTLRGKSGSKLIEVNANGQLVSTISSSESEPGSDITLTIDMELQQLAEESVRQAVEAISSGGTFYSRYGNHHYSKAYRHCATGAAAVVDVRSGEVLALASYPGYDPNLFSEGISQEDWNSLQGDNPLDPLSARPLYNIATMTSVQPGSTFKPVTALNALDKGFSPSERLKDNGYISFGEKTFGCWIWNQYHSRHGYLDMRSALEVSCNYFFYDLGAGYDFASGRRIMKSDIHDVMAYAEKLGLGQKTGIEVNEAAAGVPSEASKAAAVASGLKYYLRMNGESLFEDEIVADQPEMAERIETIAGWITEEGLTKEVLRDRLAEQGVRGDQTGSLASEIMNHYYNEAKWTTGDQLNLSIGQGENAYTPVQMARYVAAVANDGTLYNLTLTKAIDGEEVQHDEGTPIENTNSEAWQVVRDGMHRVAQGGSGTARKLFYGVPYSLGAKTGTAQKSGRISTMDEVEYIRQHLSGIAPSVNFEQVEEEMHRLMRDYPDIYTSERTAVRRAVMNLSGASSERIDAYKESYDNFSWFVAFSPYEEPEIAVAVLLVQGGAGSNAGVVAREIIGKYHEIQASGGQDGNDSGEEPAFSASSDDGSDPDV